ncbi:hypothetical protein PACTADRAFT_32055 [Pachysolen tannophilus NRRL Y-2460]|uniref:Vacuolar protein sorting-associated protein 51 homolog n=1 Tax=Pachysolen tannophilus NRRL Y-2460 TaxID=669874 RepID=A0A1E4TXV7_PACTA|nr:hypothetical protein PACTADRAFT_32055 [Pachysolen tannophilus NRRL Y-2460]
MSDIISHKKQIRIKNNISDNRRRALKEFYKLQQANKQELNNLNTIREDDGSRNGNGNENGNGNNNGNGKAEPDYNSTNDEDSNDALNLENFDKYVKEKDFRKLLAKENLITEELNINQGEIKSIIYNNYYELIKISNYLESLKKGGDSKDINKKTTSNVILNDDAKFTVGDEDSDEDNEDAFIKNLNRIKEGISAIKNTDFTI